MVSNSLNPYWRQAKQYQQRQKQSQQRPHSQGQGQSERHGWRLRDGFDEEWKDKNVEIERVKGETTEVVKGKVVDVTRYWLKISVDGQVLYVNKAYVLSIRPVEIESGTSGGVDDSRRQ